jgi:hypothetical protein
VIRFGGQSVRSGSSDGKAEEGDCAGKREEVYLGNLEARRDWGYVPEHVDLMWRML